MFEVFKDFEIVLDLNSYVGLDLCQLLSACCIIPAILLAYLPAASPPACYVTTCLHACVLLHLSACINLIKKVSVFNNEQRVKDSNERRLKGLD